MERKLDEVAQNLRDEDIDDMPDYRDFNNNNDFIDETEVITP